MIDASLHVSEGPVTRNVRVRATNLARAMQIAGRNKPGVSVKLIGPVAPTISAEDTTFSSESVVARAA